jgi:hypothetical protein
MIGRLCLFILRKAQEHDELEFGRIIGQAYVRSSKYCYGTTLVKVQDRIVFHWGDMARESKAEWIRQ